MLLLSNVLILKPALLIELGHAVVAMAAVKLKAIWCAVVFGEVAWALLPCVAPFAVLPKVFLTWRPGFWLDTYHKARSTMTCFALTLILSTVGVTC